MGRHKVPIFDSAFRNFLIPVHLPDVSQFNYVQLARGHYLDDMILAYLDPSKLRFEVALLRAKVATIKWQCSSKTVFFPKDIIEFFRARWSSEGIQRLDSASRTVSAIRWFVMAHYIK